jgi:peptide/nickel transport system ATP-binding protein
MIPMAPENRMPEASLPPAAEPLLAVRDLQVTFRQGAADVEAVSGVSFSVAPGEVVALVGESGSGKTVSALATLGLLPRVAQVTMSAGSLAGHDLTRAGEEELRHLRGATAGMIFQDPLSSLNPVKRVGDQVVEAIRLHSPARRADARRQAIDRLAQVGIPDAARRFSDYPHQFSGGMRQRAMIAMALAASPPLLIADEPTTALDVTVQAQILELIQRLQRELSMGVLLITHDLGVVSRVADRVLVMYRGEIVEEGSAAQILRSPAEDYTKALLAAIPRLDVPRERPARPAAPAAAGDPLLAIDDVKVTFTQGGGLFRKAWNIAAVAGVDLEVEAGKTLGLVGESGCGKTTLGRAILQLTRPTEGEVRIGGQALSGIDDRDLRPLRRRMQIVFQDPQASLTPRHRVERILTEPLELHGLRTTAEEKRRRVDELLELVGLDPALRRRLPHELSGGQRQRVGIARALAVEPDVIVLDESVSALDVSVQAQVLALLERLQRELGVAYVFISHDLGVIRHIADSVAVMYLGRIVEQGPSEAVYLAPRHPYTAALLSAVPVPDPERERRRTRIILKGDPPSPADPPSGCPFSSRCWLRERLGNPEVCTREAPPLVQATGTAGHLAACHFSEEQAANLPDGAMVATPEAAA